MCVGTARTDRSFVMAGRVLVLHRVQFTAPNLMLSRPSVARAGITSVALGERAAKSIADATPARGSLLRMSLGRGRMGVMDGRGHSTVNAARHSKLNARAVGEQSALAPLPVSGISPAQVVRGLHPFGLVTACRCFSLVRHRVDPAFVARFPSRSARRRVSFYLRPAARLRGGSQVGGMPPTLLAMLPV